jgi:copper chaperone CopZ
MASITVKSPNISCDHCIRTIQNELAEIPGVRRVAGDVASKTLTIDFEAPANVLQIAARLRDINYPAQE